MNLDTKVETQKPALPAAPKNNHELFLRILSEEESLKMKSELLKRSGKNTEAEQTASAADMQYRMRKHLTAIGQNYFKEEINRLFPEFDLSKDEKAMTQQEVEVYTWGGEHANKMPIGVIQKRIEGYKLGLEATFKNENTLHAVSELGLSQQRDLHAVDSLSTLLRACQPQGRKK